MNPIALTLILFTLVMGSVLTMFSSHWLTVWLGLEMNLFAIVPLMIKPHSPRSIEGSTKYFLTQATASMMLMMSVMINFMNTGQWSLTHMMSQFSSFLMMLALLTKLGMSPFHFWVPEVLQSTSLMAGTILLTWQKLAPLSIMYQIAPSMNYYILMSSAMTSIILGGWGGLNQTQLRKIMAYSSIAHMGWMTAIITYNPSITLLNLMIYIIMTITLFMLFIIKQSTTMISLATKWNKAPILMPMVFITLMSTGGLPPFSGFIPKWLIIQELTKNSNLIIPLSMSILALLNLYFYMRLAYSTTLTMFPTSNNAKMNWLFTSIKHKNTLSTLFTVSNLLLPLTPMLMFVD
uniref:NADH dehydrogenase subunit 2 n=1 Tax=Macroscelides flavicaudatus TaxID=432356 RepID=UPI0024359D37|nr:NADH dehydrogenase subunit 2 [Macroscelides flavicaudatus]WEW63434.1 NADH dehydrogenase subunit 2 [Macroscelides flavicaudatus]